MSLVPVTLLGLLEREPSHGYDLKRDYDVLFGRGRPLPFGQVYATLARLARDGKVVAGPSEPGAGPDRKRYAITGEGVAGGEIVAVRAPSGSGKSTLLHCLAGIPPPDSGEVCLGGRRLDTMGEAERSGLRRERFGFVFQSGQLVPELTAEENVALPLLLGGARRADSLRQARGWLARLGLDGLEERRSGELSGGQAQRVALARGLVAHPQVP